VELPEGASVTVIASDGDETFEVDAATEKKLLDAIAECERGETFRWNVSCRRCAAASEPWRKAFHG